MAIVLIVVDISLIPDPPGWFDYSSSWRTSFTPPTHTIIGSIPEIIRGLVNKSARAKLHIDLNGDLELLQRLAEFDGVDPEIFLFTSTPNALILIHLDPITKRLPSKFGQLDLHNEEHEQEPKFLPPSAANISTVLNEKFEQSVKALGNLLRHIQEMAQALQILRGTVEKLHELKKTEPVMHISLEEHLRERVARLQQGLRSA
eukprot:CAMPEP_0185791468 /NCGR_PEP_ID=MMETSP1174-20130828/158392_1 /TAXON_ID=35687 /ORGANISM="Dictyocha speculum, Strain CCMP1381" /LENGTH=202 /DNA_ID=CAMNT_0028486421 /DNA_START=766 /DNA_END=1374 /DNA_ORIENTATION=+